MAEKKPELYDAYPLSTVIAYNIINLSINIAGLFLTYIINPFLSLAFLLYIMYMEFKQYKEGCRYCYYHGKRCFSGRGLIAGLIFKKGDPKVFCEKTMTFKDFLPHMLTAFVPLTAGVYLLVQQFDMMILAIAVWPMIVNFVGNPIIYGKMACPHCKPGAKCCPATEYFMKQQK